MANLRNWLKEANFNFEKGMIIYQEVGDDYPGWEEPCNAKVISNNDSILDKEFESGFGGPNCPRIVAKDEEAIYFPSQYDGATGLEKVYHNIKCYLNWKKYISPYPGG